jgi:hypothetical protein
MLKSPLLRQPGNHTSWLQTHGFASHPFEWFAFITGFYDKSILYFSLQALNMISHSNLYTRSIILQFGSFVHIFCEQLIRVSVFFCGAFNKSFLAVLMYFRDYFKLSYKRRSIRYILNIVQVRECSIQWHYCYSHRLGTLFQSV